jgi:hypothetical protein
MITANMTVAAPTPASAERQPRVTPTARTIVAPPPSRLRSPETRPGTETRRSFSSIVPHFVNGG